MWSIDTLLQKTEENKIEFSPINYLSSIPVFNNSQLLLACITYDYEHGENYEKVDELRASIKRQLLPMINHAEGSTLGEPTFENGHIWAYALVCQALALIKKKKTLWDLFSKEEQDKFDLVMKAFIFTWNFGCNYYNDFRTGITLHGNYHKRGGANYIFCNHGLLLFLTIYFDGIKNINKIISETTYKSFIAELKAAGFTNAVNAFSTPGFRKNDGKFSPDAKKLFGEYKTDWKTNDNKKIAYLKETNNNFVNTIYGGQGYGALIPIFYKENQDPEDYSFPFSVYTDIVERNFTDDKTKLPMKCVSTLEIEEKDFTAHIADGTVSPYDGRLGLLREFNIYHNQTMGRRSSLFHCEIDFVLVASLISTLTKLTDFDYKNHDFTQYVEVGMGDFIYKKEHGYIGYSMGHIEYEEEANRAQSEWWRDWWKSRKI